MNIDVQSGVSGICQEGVLRTWRRVSNPPAIAPILAILLYFATVDEPEMNVGERFYIRYLNKPAVVGLLHSFVSEAGFGILVKS